MKAVLLFALISGACADDSEPTTTDDPEAFEQGNCDASLSANKVEALLVAARHCEPGDTCVTLDDHCCGVSVTRQRAAEAEAAIEGNWNQPPECRVQCAGDCEPYRPAPAECAFNRILDRYQCRPTSE